MVLPWPWGGERFELPALKPITYITGPLGSGKTRLARAIAEALPGAALIELERRTGDGSPADSALKERVESHLEQLAGEGADLSPALTALILAMEASPAAALVIDMVEQGLDQATQHALRRYLKSQPFAGRPLFLLTRSSSILDLADLSAREAILYCPANHDVPMIVMPRKGARIRGRRHLPCDARRPLANGGRDRLAAECRLTRKEKGPQGPHFYLLAP